MRCFYHHEKEAVGTCKSCGKGLCPDCAVDLGRGLACRGRCEENVKTVIQLVERNILLSGQRENMLKQREDILKRSDQMFSRTALFNLAFGAILIAWGSTNFERYKFIIILGACFMVFGLFDLAKRRDKK